MVASNSCFFHKLCAWEDAESNFCKTDVLTVLMEKLLCALKYLNIREQRFYCYLSCFFTWFNFQKPKTYISNEFSDRDGHSSLNRMRLNLIWFSPVTITLSSRKQNQTPKMGGLDDLWRSFQPKPFYDQLNGVLFRDDAGDMMSTKHQFVVL